MTNPRTYLTGIGHWFPDTVIDNQFFAELDIGSSAQWIEDRVGIRERRSVLSHSAIRALRHGEATRSQLLANGDIMSMAGMCHKPWQLAQKRAGIIERKVAVDLLIAGSSVPDWDIPANACSIADQLGIAATAFDVNSACSSFIVNLHVARSMLIAQTAHTAAIFNAERYSTRVDFSDRSSSVLFGDAAAASIVEAVVPPQRGLEIIDTIVHSDPSGYQHVRIPEGGFFSQNGAAVQKFAVTKTIAVTHEILERNRLQIADLRYFIGHQANFRMLTAVCNKLGITPEHHLWNVDTKGNQGGAGAPVVLSTHWDNFLAGDLIVVAVVGSGLTWGAALLRAL